MSAIATRPRTPPAAPVQPQSSVESVHTYDVPAAGFDFSEARMQLIRAHSVAVHLVRLFGGECFTDSDDIRKTEGLMGTVQYLHHTLMSVEFALTDRVGKFPDGFAQGVFHARGLASLMDEMARAEDYAFHSGDHVLSAYFDAIKASCQMAIDAVERAR